MKKMLSLLFVILLGVIMIMNDAEARRFGGGRSFGISRSTSSFSRPSAAASTMQNTARGGQNRWLGPLAGLAAGGLLASLFMGHGFAGGGMMLLVAAGVFMLLLSFLRRSSRDRMQSANSNLYHMQHQQYEPTNSAATGSVPLGFDQADFLRQAKVLFIRLQAAYDQNNLDDLSQFTTPDVFAEIKMQLQERGDAPNQTDVVSLDAELLDISGAFREQTASVRFSGLIKEDRNAPAIAINEIWHFRTSISSDKWQVAGVQQH